MLRVDLPFKASGKVLTGMEFLYHFFALSLLYVIYVLA